jgi:hypothetical protein
MHLESICEDNGSLGWHSPDVLDGGVQRFEPWPAFTADRKAFSPWIFGILWIFGFLEDHQRMLWI